MVLTPAHLAFALA